MPRFEPEDVPVGTVFNAHRVDTDTGIGTHPDGTTSPIVRLTLHGKWNHGAPDTLTVHFDARGRTESLGRQLTRAARAAKAQHRQHGGR